MIGVKIICRVTVRFNNVFVCVDELVDQFAENELLFDSTTKSLQKTKDWNKNYEISTVSKTCVYRILLWCIKYMFIQYNLIIQLFVKHKWL